MWMSLRYLQTCLWITCDAFQKFVVLHVELWWIAMEYAGFDYILAYFWGFHPGRQPKQVVVKKTELNLSINRQIYVPTWPLDSSGNWRIYGPLGHRGPSRQPIGSSVNRRTYGPDGHGPTATSTWQYVCRWRGTNECKPIYSSGPHHRWMYLIFISTDKCIALCSSAIYSSVNHRIYDKSVGLNLRNFHSFL
jgi:hypothetical protein